MKIRLIQGKSCQVQGLAAHKQIRHPDGRATTVPVHGGCDVSPSSFAGLSETSA